MVFTKGYKVSEKQRKNQSETRKRLISEGKIDMKKQMSNKKIRKKISDSLKGHECYKNPERGKNISKALKKAYKEGRKKQYCGSVVKGKNLTKRYNGKQTYVSHIVWFEHYGCLPKKNEVVHHINFDESNNEISNLQLMTKAEHTILHTKIRVKNGVKK